MGLKNSLVVLYKVKQLTYDLTTPLWRIYRRQVKIYTYTKSHTRIFIAVLFHSNRCSGYRA